MVNSSLLYRAAVDDRGMIVPAFLVVAQKDDTKENGFSAEIPETGG